MGYYSTVVFFCYVNSLTTARRKKLFWAVLFAILAVVLYTTWEIVYISFFYDEVWFYRGYGDPDLVEAVYLKETKEFTVVLELCSSLVVLVYLSICAWTCWNWMYLAAE